MIKMSPQGTDNCHKMRTLSVLSITYHNVRPRGQYRTDCINIIYRMGGVGEVSTGKITPTGQYVQDGWYGRGQYRMDYTNRPLSTTWVVWERSVQEGLHQQANVYRLGGIGEVNTGHITPTGHYLQNGWCWRGQYRADYTNMQLSTGWVVMKRPIQDVLHKQDIIYSMVGVGEVNTGRITQTDHYLQDGYWWKGSIQDILHQQAIFYRIGGVGEVNTGRITPTGHFLQDGWCRRGQYRTYYTNRPLPIGWVV